MYSSSQRRRLAFVKSLGGDKAQLDFETDGVVLKSTHHFVTIRCADLDAALQAVINSENDAP